MKKLLWIALVLTAVVGCSEPGPDPKVEDNRVEAAKMQREIFTRANGNWDQLTEPDKQEFLKFFKGDETAAKTMWDFMKSKEPGANQTTTGPVTPGKPGGG